MVEVKDVIFLGAGASAAEGAPLQRDLFKEFFKIHTNRERSTSINESLGEFFKKVFGIDIQGNLRDQSFPTFEEILGVLDLAIEREEGLRGYSATGEEPKIHAIRQGLIFLIARILKEKLSGASVHHKKLVNRLRTEKMIRKTAFISLNYDIIIDNALMDLYQSSGIDLDYRIDFTNFTIKPQGGNATDEQHWRKPRRGKVVQLYKIHGSLNWLYCPTCISVRLTPKDKRVATLIENPAPCEKCESKMEPIIVPPTFFKETSNFYLQQIWRKAEEMLMYAKRIYFCGYSFPDADINIKYMLKRVEVNSGRTQEVYVINKPQGERSEYAAEEVQRYKRFWSQKERVHYLDLSFEDFCQKGESEAREWHR